jgi:hypothetical protein
MLQYTKFMGVYSNTEIKTAIEDGTIVCVPYRDAHVSEASLDFTLGHYFYKQEYQPEAAGVYNPFDETDVARYFKGPLEAIPHSEWCEKNGVKLFENIPPTTRSSYYSPESGFWLIPTSSSVSARTVAPARSKAAAAGGVTALRYVLMPAGSILAILTALPSKSII